MIIASDFDGTIFIDNKISEDDIKAIKDFQQAGNLFAIVTGRSYHSLEAIILGKLEPDFIIANNGSHILAREEKVLKEIYSFPIHVEDGKKFMEVYKAYKPLAFTDYGSFSKIEDAKGEIRALGIYTNEKLINKFADKFDFHYSIGVIDVVNNGIDKQKGIDIMKAYYSYEGDVIAVGDDYNDIGFLSATPLSYTLSYVENQEVIKVCKYKIDSISELIRRLI